MMLSSVTHSLSSRQLDAQRELAAVQGIIILHRDRILEAWREHCGATE